MSRRRTKHKLARDIDYCDLKERLSSRLGIPVEILGRPPTDTDDGEIIVINAEDGAPMHVDTVVVQACLAVTGERPDNRSNEERTLANLSAATNPEEQLTAIRGFLERAATDEKHRMASLGTGGMEDVKSYSQ